MNRNRLAKKWTADSNYVSGRVLKYWRDYWRLTGAHEVARVPGRLLAVSKLRRRRDRKAEQR